MSAGVPPTFNVTLPDVPAIDVTIPSTLEINLQLRGIQGPVGPEGPPGQWSELLQIEYNNLLVKNPKILYLIKPAPPPPPTPTVDYVATPAYITAVGGLVSQWVAKGNWMPLIQPAGASQPMYNGIDAIDFTPNHPLFNTPFMDLASFTIFTVVNFSAPPNDWGGGFTIMADPGPPTQAEITNKNGSMVMRTTTNAFKDLWNADAQWLAVHEFKYDASILTMKYTIDNGTPKTFILTGGTGPISPVTFTLGDAIGWTDFHGSYKAINIFNRALSDAESSSTHAKLKAQFGTP